LKLYPWVTKQTPSYCSPKDLNPHNQDNPKQTTLSRYVPTQLSRKKAQQTAQKKKGFQHITAETTSFTQKKNSRKQSCYCLSEQDSILPLKNQIHMKNI
jgi:hypothetical protein